MSIVTKIKTKVKNAAKKGADALAKTSQLSPSQIKAIDEKRAKYLEAKPSMDDEAAQAFIEKSLGTIGVEVFQAYLPQLKELYLPINLSEDTFSTNKRIRYFDVTKWVTDKEENSIDKLINVYQVLSGEDCNIALIYHKTQKELKTILAISNTTEESSIHISNDFCERLMSAVKGNFPGSVIGAMQTDFPNEINRDDKNGYYVASVSNMAAEKSEKFISQSIEKLFDGVMLDDKEDYTIILLAEPIANQVEERKARLYELYTALAPFSNWQTNYIYTESDAEGSQAQTGGQFGGQGGRQNSEGTTKTNSFGLAFILSASHAVAKTVSQATNIGFNFGVNFSRSSNVTMSVGKNEGITNNYVNYGVQNTLKIIEEQIKRLEQSAALGMWDFAAYVVSNRLPVAENAANMYLSLTQGEKSFMTTAAVNVWSREASKTIMQSLIRLEHPLFGLNVSEKSDEQWLMYPSLVTAAAGVSGKELAYALNFPKTSVSGLPVLQSVSFGREIHKYDNNKNGDSINIGQVYHMRNPEGTKVSLDINSLASHTFVTGSTGAGKSNAIYHIINALKHEHKKFLIIEPAKGEYKEVFGGMDGVEVYGTNPYETKLLKINPFAFTEGVHVLEHIDRLIEIFNACWPMYAAMPAVLKDAVERIYVNKGWDLRYSVCEPKVFPTLYDLLKVLPQVMKESEYSNDTKSDYSGALITRVKSLTNGINGQIFCTSNSAEDENKRLFDGNVIVDISRVGSTETKSLIMGILIMKLQEYRMSKGDINEDLQHVTVLEEAHNLLRRTSQVQSQESSNLQGKSVEMISNAIAEMRTYGEGFIIADQAPGLLDESVIRNTNTKIIFRLPDEDDRVLAGRSEALTDSQISELAKLPLGVAAVYQNDWIEAVLCHFEEFGKEKHKPYEYKPVDESTYLKNYFYKLFGLDERRKLSPENVDFIREWKNTLDVSEYTQSLLDKTLEGKTLTTEERRDAAYNIYKGKRLGFILQDSKDEDIGYENMRRSINSMFNIKDDALTNAVRDLTFRSILKKTENTELAHRYHRFM